LISTGLSEEGNVVVTVAVVVVVFTGAFSSLGV